MAFEYRYPIKQSTVDNPFEVHRIVEIIKRDFGAEHVTARVVDGDMPYVYLRADKPFTSAEEVNYQIDDGEAVTLSIQIAAESNYEGKKTLVSDELAVEKIKRHMTKSLEGAEYIIVNSFTRDVKSNRSGQSREQIKSKGGFFTNKIVEVLVRAEVSNPQLLLEQMMTGIGKKRSYGIGMIVKL